MCKLSSSDARTHGDPCGLRQHGGPTGPCRCTRRGGSRSWLSRQGAMPRSTSGPVQTSAKGSVAQYLDRARCGVAASARPKSPVIRGRWFESSPIHGCRFKSGPPTSPTQVPCASPPVAWRGVGGSSTGRAGGPRSVGRGLLPALVVEVARGCHHCLTQAPGKRLAVSRVRPLPDRAGQSPWPTPAHRQDTTGTAHHQKKGVTMPGAPILPQCPTRKVGKTVYINVPGRVPVIKAKKR